MIQFEEHIFQMGGKKPPTSDTVSNLYSQHLTKRFQRFRSFLAAWPFVADSVVSGLFKTLIGLRTYIYHVYIETAQTSLIKGYIIRCWIELFRLFEVNFFKIYHQLNMTYKPACIYEVQLIHEIYSGSQNILKTKGWIGPGWLQMENGWGISNPEGFNMQTGIRNAWGPQGKQHRNAMMSGWKGWDLITHYGCCVWVVYKPYNLTIKINQM